MNNNAPAKATTLQRSIGQSNATVCSLGRPRGFRVLDRTRRFDLEDIAAPVQELPWK
jgi:hypothetical protein